MCDLCGGGEVEQQFHWHVAQQAAEQKSPSKFDVSSVLVQYKYFFVYRCILSTVGKKEVIPPPGKEVETDKDNNKGADTHTACR